MYITSSGRLHTLPQDGDPPAQCHISIVTEFTLVICVVWPARTTRATYPSIRIGAEKQPIDQNPCRVFEHADHSPKLPRAAVHGEIDQLKVRAIDETIDWDLRLVEVRRPDQRGPTCSIKQ